MIVEDSGAAIESLRIEKDPPAGASRVFPRGRWMSPCPSINSHFNKRLRDRQPACYPQDPQLKMPVKMRLPTGKGEQQQDEGR